MIRKRTKWMRTAALILPIHASKISGSILGNTFSHNAGGMYMRGRTTPINPSTPEQQTVRGLMGSLVNAWRAVLTDAQRDAWATYGANVSVVNRVGDTTFRGGFSWYVGCNVPRLQAGLPRVDDAPVIFDRGFATEPGIGTIVAPSTVPITFETADDWVSTDDAAMLVYISRPFSPTVNFFNGPYQFAGVILGDATTPPTSPAAITSPFVFSAGQKIGVRLVVTQGDGRLGSPFRFQAIVP